MRKFRSFSFGIQIIMMLLVVVLSISIMVQAFAAAKVQSDEAKVLSQAITLAADGAEVVMAQKSEEKIFRVLNEKDNAILADEIIAIYDEDLNPDQQGNLVMAIRLDPKTDFTEVLIKIYYFDKEIYTLNTGVKGVE